MPFTGSGTGIQNADDVFFSGLSDNETLTYDSGTAKWQNSSNEGKAYVLDHDAPRQNPATSVPLSTADKAIFVGTSTPASIEVGDIFAAEDPNPIGIDITPITPVQASNVTTLQLTIPSTAANDSSRNDTVFFYTVIPSESNTASIDLSGAVQMTPALEGGGSFHKLYVWYKHLTTADQNVVVTLTSTAAYYLTFGGFIARGTVGSGDPMDANKAAVLDLSDTQIISPSVNQSGLGASFVIASAVGTFTNLEPFNTTPAGVTKIHSVYTQHVSAGGQTAFWVGYHDLALRPTGTVVPAATFDTQMSVGKRALTLPILGVL